MTRPTTPGTSPLRGRYLVRNRLWNAWLRLNDLALDVFNVGGSVTQTAPPQVPPPSPQRILVAVGGHLGDAVLATSALRDLHTAFPRCELGVVTGSWNRGVLARHPRVRHFHTVDHWKTSRSHEPLLARWLTTRRTRALAAAEIRKVGYDAAIDLSPYYPNAARLLWSADIPVRIGYVSGGDGPLYTRRLPWRPGRHITEDHRLLVAQLAPEFQGAAPVCELPEPDPDTVRRTEGILQAAGVAADNFVVIHPGAGHARKEWLAEKWQQVARELMSDGIAVVLTGSGARETSNASRIAASVPGLINLSNRLEWEEFCAVIARARLLLSVDTVTTHVAAATGTPCVALMAAMDDPMRWRPLLAQSTVLTHAVSCAPCFRGQGCDEMSCVRSIEPETVLAAARRHAGV